MTSHIGITYNFFLYFVPAPSVMLHFDSENCGTYLYAWPDRVRLLQKSHKKGTMHSKASIFSTRLNIHAPHSRASYAITVCQAPGGSICASLARISSQKWVPCIFFQISFSQID